MKAPPRRKGNNLIHTGDKVVKLVASMKAPPRRKGNAPIYHTFMRAQAGLNESPSKKEGKFRACMVPLISAGASMKAPPRRKGNYLRLLQQRRRERLNESPSKKEGKCHDLFLVDEESCASMKAPPRRKGNDAGQLELSTKSLSPQ